MAGHGRFISLTYPSWKAALRLYSRWAACSWPWTGAVAPELELRLAAARLSGRLSAAQRTHSQMSGRFDSRSLKQEPTMIWWWVRWASFDSQRPQREMRQGQRRWSYLFRLLTSDKSRKRCRLDIWVGGRSSRPHHQSRFLHPYCIPIQEGIHPPRRGHFPLRGPACCPACCRRLQTVARPHTFA